MKIIYKYLVISLFLIGNLFPQGKGHLVIIGGGKKPKFVMEKIVQLAGGKDSKIVVIPMASSEPLESAKGSMEDFKEAGSENIDFVICDQTTANDDSTLAKLNGAKGIYFGGGDQSLLTKALLGTKFLSRIKDIYNSGGVISGTSAGAAVMSKIMITGDELLNKDSTNPFNSIRKENIKTTEGFGFIETAIIDQHFVKRKRLNRLISVVLENPKLLGIGIDESTAIVVNPNNTFEVLGEASVLVFDASKSKVRSDKNGNLSGDDINLKILINGDRFDLKTKKLIKRK